MFSFVWTIGDISNECLLIRCGSHLRLVNLFNMMRCCLWQKSFCLCTIPWSSVCPQPSIVFVYLLCVFGAQKICYGFIYSVDCYLHSIFSLHISRKWKRANVHTIFGYCYAATCIKNYFIRFVDTVVILGSKENKNLRNKFLCWKCFSLSPAGQNERPHVNTSDSCLCISLLVLGIFHNNAKEIPISLDNLKRMHNSNISSES